MGLENPQNRHYLQQMFSKYAANLKPKNKYFMELKVK